VEYHPYLILPTNLSKTKSKKITFFIRLRTAIM